LPETLQNWPPTLVTNFVYGCALVKRWGKTGSVDTLQKSQITKQAADENCRDQSNSRSARFTSRKEVNGSGEEEQQEMDINIMESLMFLRQRSLVSDAPPMQQGPSLEDVSMEKVRAWLQPH
jgi:hypothetical protein